jgi:hypothetical protein
MRKTMRSVYAWIFYNISDTEWLMKKDSDSASLPATLLHHKGLSSQVYVPDTVHRLLRLHGALHRAQLWHKMQGLRLCSKLQLKQITTNILEYSFTV